MNNLINEALVIAMKARDTNTLSTLRMLKGAIQLEEISKKAKLSDEDIISIVYKQIKLRKDSIEEFEKANRKDLIDQYQFEIDILNKYLPIQLTDEEIGIIVDEAIKETKTKNKSDFGKVMSNLSLKVRGKADMSKVSNILKSKLDF